MVKVNKYLILIQLFVLTLIYQSIIQCAARIQTTKVATNLDLELIENARLGNKEKVKQLIEAGANVNAADAYGYTALLWVAIKGYNEIFELLIKHGANVNTANIHRYTALTWAAYYSSKEIVELLLKAGANIEHKNLKGNKAIDYAKINSWDSELIKKNKSAIVKMIEGEQSRREAVVKKWIKDKFAKEITESTSSLLIPDISNIIAEYCSIEYTDIPLEYRLYN